MNDSFEKYRVEQKLLLCNELKLKNVSHESQWLPHVVHSGGNDAPCSFALLLLRNKFSPNIFSVYFEIRWWWQF